MINKLKAKPGTELKNTLRWMKVNTGHTKIYEVQLKQCFKRNLYQQMPIKKEEKFQMNNLTSHFKKLEKEAKTRGKRNGGKMND